jgi:alkanesulfonate monooxygenase SsuD/methylene tetrahydromethanopterin reductase-like flavin-dependent oxidoreductase (luciferase family)
MTLPVELVQRAEALGFDSVWTAEAYGSDATSPLAYLAAVTERIRLGTASRSTWVAWAIATRTSTTT